jgi:hypothetical protein
MGAGHMEQGSDPVVDLYLPGAHAVQLESCPVYAIVMWPYVGEILAHTDRQSATHADVRTNQNIRMTISPIPSSLVCNSRHYL